MINNLCELNSVGRNIAYYAEVGVWTGPPLLHKLTVWTLAAMFLEEKKNN